MEDFLPYVRLIKRRFNLFRSSASSFSFQYLILFLKFSRSCVLSSSSFSSSYSFHFRHLILNGIMKEATSSQVWPILLAFLRTILFRSVLFSPIRSRTCLLVTFSDHFIISILFQHISKFSKYFRSNFLSIQVSEPYRAMVQT